MKNEDRNAQAAIAYGHRVDGLTYAEIARQMGISPGCARRAVGREVMRRVERRAAERRSSSIGESPKSES